MSKFNGMWIWLCKAGEKASIIFLIDLRTITLSDKTSSLYKEWLWSTSQWAEVSECVIHLISTCWLISRELFLYFILILSKSSQFHSLSISGKIYLCHSFIPHHPLMHLFLYPSMHAFTQFTLRTASLQEESPDKNVAHILSKNVNKQTKKLPKYSKMH